MSDVDWNDSQYRKTLPMATGVLDYFPAALAEVAKLSRAGNEKHNPGQSLHWSRGKSSDHADCILRHLVDRGTIDPLDGITHTAKVAWRALALLQEELEAAGAPLSRGSRVRSEADVHNAAVSTSRRLDSQSHAETLHRDVTRKQRILEAEYQERRALDGF